MRFELDKQKSELTNLNVRVERAGEDPQPATDLHFLINIDNGDMAMFAPALRSCLWHKDGSAAQGDAVNAQHEMPYLRFPKMKPFEWDDEIVGADVTIAHGLGGESDLKFPLCKIGKFSIDPQEGGRCMIGFRVQCHPDEKQAGKLYLLQQQKVDITVVPPDVDDKPTTDLAGKIPTPPRKSTPPKATTKPAAAKKVALKRKAKKP